MRAASSYLAAPRGSTGRIGSGDSAATPGFAGPHTESRSCGGTGLITGRREGGGTGGGGRGRGFSIGAGASTTTVSVYGASSSRSATRNSTPGCIVVPTSTPANPSRRNRSMTGPTGTAGNTQRPVRSVTAVRTCPPAMVTTTATPGNLPPELSVTST